MEAWNNKNINGSIENKVEYMADKRGVVFNETIFMWGLKWVIWGEGGILKSSKL